MKTLLMLVAGSMVVCVSWVIASEPNPSESKPIATVPSAATAPPAATAPAIEPGAAIEPPSTVGEARARARMLHEMVHGALQVMHRDFFDEDDAIAIPSASLEDVFHEMEVEYGMKLKWLIVNTDLINVDHEAEGPFEKQAIKLLAEGKPFAEHANAEFYQFAGAIQLHSQCLKCHIKRRTTNENRTAGLVIRIPMTLSERASKK